MNVYVILANDCLCWVDFCGKKKIEPIKYKVPGNPMTIIVDPTTGRAGIDGPLKFDIPESQVEEDIIVQNRCHCVDKNSLFKDICAKMDFTFHSVQNVTAKTKKKKKYSHTIKINFKVNKKIGFCTCNLSAKGHVKLYFGLILNLTLNKIHPPSHLP